MKNPTNNSNDCLIDCKELMRKHVASSCININCEQVISMLTSAIDIEKFKAWFDRNIPTFQNKTNIQSYFNRAFAIELEKGTFEKRVVHFSYITFLVALREKNISYPNDASARLEFIWEEISTHNISIEEMRSLNKQIYEYMKEGQTFDDYVNLLKRSKKIKAMNIDWSAIDKKIEQFNVEWEETMSFFREDEGNDREPKEVY